MTCAEFEILYSDYVDGLLRDPEKTDLERHRASCASCAEIARDIRNQYTIAYHSSKPANISGFRVVHVEATAPGAGKLRVITRHGYYANSKRQPTQTAEEAKP